MMENTNMNWVAMSDRAIIAAIGQYIKHQRLEQNKTQEQVAMEAGINRWTLSQLENGSAVTMLSLIQIMRALHLLPMMDIFRIEERISPIELAKLERKQRQRARNKSEGLKSESDW